MSVRVPRTKDLWGPLGDESETHRCGRSNVPGDDGGNWARQRRCVASLTGQPHVSSGTVYRRRKRSTRGSEVAPETPGVPDSRPRTGGVGGVPEGWGDLGGVLNDKGPARVVVGSQKRGRHVGFDTPCQNGRVVRFQFRFLGEQRGYRSPPPLRTHRGHESLGGETEESRGVTKGSLHRPDTQVSTRVKPLYLQDLWTEKKKGKKEEEKRGGRRRIVGEEEE